jgi:hypothetical protein
MKVDGADGRDLGRPNQLVLSNTISTSILSPYTAGEGALQFESGVCLGTLWQNLRSTSEGSSRHRIVTPTRPTKRLGVIAGR